MAAHHAGPGAGGLPRHRAGPARLRAHDGGDPDYDDDLASYRLFNLVRDVMGLLDALGRTEVALLAGHEFGASVAAWAALIRPDIFRKLALMSAPFPGPPDITPQPPPARSIHDELAALDRPRKHYQWYYSTRQANREMQDCPQGVHAFLRAYFHHKSADWAGNRPFRLAAWSAEELARMPTYYIMDRDRSMAETAEEEMPGEEEIAACRWLPDAELAVYAREYERNGFQGGLQWYRCRTSGRFDREHELFAGRRIEVPACFIAGAADWGNRAIRTEITRLVCEAKQLAVLVIDEAQHLRNDVLEDLRLLCNFAMDSENRLCLVLVGLTELRRRLAMACHESLAQRLVVRHHLNGLDRDELDAYLSHRLRLAGCELTLFEPPAVEALSHSARGMPRLINRIAHYALTAAALGNARTVTAEHLEHAVAELRL